MQEPQLFDDEEQEEAPGPAGDQEILLHVPSAHGAQRSEVTSGEWQVARARMSRAGFSLATNQ
jgi:hypothetical protein